MKTTAHVKLKCTWRIDFFVCSIKSPQCSIKITKQNFDSDFPSLCFDLPKRELSLPVGYKNRRLGMIVTSFQDLKSFGKTDFSATFSCFVINSAFLYHFLTNLLAHSKKMTEKFVFLKWRHNQFQSPVFGLAVLYPTISEISRFWYIKTRARKIAIESIFLLYLSVYLPYTL